MLAIAFVGTGGGTAKLARTGAIVAARGGGLTTGALSTIRTGVDGNAWWRGPEMERSSEGSERGPSLVARIDGTTVGTRGGAEPAANTGCTKVSAVIKSFSVGAATGGGTV